jgi:hypothetical protein
MCSITLTMKRPRWYRTLLLVPIVIFLLAIQLWASPQASLTNKQNQSVEEAIIDATLTLPQSVGALLVTPSSSDQHSTSIDDSTLSTMQVNPLDSSLRRPRPPLTDKPRCLVFFHVPKTAGSSVRRFLRQLSGELRWKFKMWYDSNDKLNNNKKNWTAGMLHAGHVTSRFLEATHTQSCLRLTVLREPADRVISLYYFLQAQRRSKEAILATPAWEDCLFHRNKTKCSSFHQYQNEVTRLFAGESLQWSTINNAPDYVNMPMNATTLKSAKQFLFQQTDLVCFQDHLDDCEQAVRRLLRLKNKTALRKSPAIPKINVNAKRPAKANITAQLRDQIRTANAWDVQLYDWARATFLDSDV